MSPDCAIPADFDPEKLVLDVDVDAPDVVLVEADVDPTVPLFDDAFVPEFFAELPVVELLWLPPGVDSPRDVEDDPLLALEAADGLDEPLGWSVAVVDPQETPASGATRARAMRENLRKLGFIMSSSPRSGPSVTGTTRGVCLLPAAAHDARPAIGRAVVLRARIRHAMTGAIGTALFSRSTSTPASRVPSTASLQFCARGQRVIRRTEEKVS